MYMVSVLESVSQVNRCTSITVDSFSNICFLMCTRYTPWFITKVRLGCQLIAEKLL